MQLTIKGFIETTLIDWEGMIASTIFLPHCNFQCPYCHAPHLVRSPNELESIPVDAVLKHVANQCGWLDGVVISGGEPTLHAELESLIRSIQSLGVEVKLDTNGSHPEVLRKLLEAGLVRSVAMDLKAPLTETRYAEAAGRSVDVDTIEESIALLRESGVDYEFRTTVCPAVLDGDDVVEIARAITGARRYVLQNFKPVNCLDSAMMGVKPYPRELREEFAENAGAFVEECYVRGSAPLPVRPRA